MDIYSAQEQEQASTEIVDELRDRKVCQECGGKIIDDWMQEQDGVTVDIVMGHNDDCTMNKKYF